MKCERCGAELPVVITAPDGYICKTCADHLCDCDECDLIGVCSAETFPERERLESCHLVALWKYQ